MNDRAPVSAAECMAQAARASAMRDKKGERYWIRKAKQAHDYKLNAYCGTYVQDGVIYTVSRHWFRRSELVCAVTSMTYRRPGYEPGS
ncbi:MAG TPA: hypothetical protein VG476_02490 [Acidimicrobiales bacterium]|nr:hypothetical protein [Acidimicrobiales bacterium]